MNQSVTQTRTKFGRSGQKTNQKLTKSITQKKNQQSTVTTGQVRENGMVTRENKIYELIKEAVITQNNHKIGQIIRNMNSQNISQDQLRKWIQQINVAQQDLRSDLISIMKKTQKSRKCQNILKHYGLKLQQNSLNQYFSYLHKISHLFRQLAQYLSYGNFNHAQNEQLKNQDKQTVEQNYKFFDYFYRIYDILYKESKKGQENQKQRVQRANKISQNKDQSNEQVKTDEKLQQNKKVDQQKIQNTQEATQNIEKDQQRVQTRPESRKEDGSNNVNQLIQEQQVKAQQGQKNFKSMVGRQQQTQVARPNTQQTIKQLGQNSVVIAENKLRYYQSIHLFFGKAFLYDKQYKLKQMLISKIQKTTDRKIRATEKIYEMDRKNKTSAHAYVDGISNWVILFRLANNNIIGAYCQDAIQPNKATNFSGVGIIFSLNSDKFYTPMPSKTANHQRLYLYEQFFLIIGNSQIRFDLQNYKLSCDFRGNFRYFNTGKDTAQMFVGTNSQKIEVITYQFYQVIFDK